MPILYRYVVRQHVGPFLFSFFVITLVFVLNLTFRELGSLLSKGLAARVIAEFFFLNLAWIVALAVPMSVLTATLTAFGRLAADNEITAIKGSGISLYRILTPVLLTSALLAIFLVWFNNSVLPDFNHRAKLLSYDITRKKPTIALEPGVVYDGLPNYNLLVREVHDRGSVSYVKQVLLDDHSEPNVIKTIMADSAVIELDESRELLNIFLFDGEIQEIDLDRPEEFRQLRFPKHLVTVPVSGMVLRRTEQGYRGDREMSAAMMREKIAELERDAQEARERISGMVAQVLAPIAGPDSTAETDSLTGTAFAGLAQSDFRRRTLADGAAATRTLQKDASDDSTAELEARRALQRAITRYRSLAVEVKAQIDAINATRASINAYWVEIHKKYSIAFASVVFVLIGAPLGITARRGSLGISGGISLVFFLIFWVCLIGGEELADRRIVSPWLAMWSPNIIVGTAGLILLVRTVHETTTIRWERLVRFLPRRLRRTLDDETAREA
jgi:lipopolysaccharide export system permease protein